ncbi:MAG: hypothetical protein JWQ98_3586 [Chlorobi bacterium]|nr:hypothetical protein [Chlorobiota bacterium]
MSDIRERAQFDIIRYANCWEDADILVEALRLRPGCACVSIASAGDNSLALLAAAPSLVLAVDISPVQIACAELKRAAIAKLDHPGFLAFLGFRPFDGDRLETYRMLRPELTADAREYWDRNVHVIASGMIHAGKFESYFHLFRRWVLPLVHGRRDVAALLAPKTGSERVEFYNRRWDTRRWRWMFRLFFSRFVMGRMGRDPEFFRYVEGSVAERILERVKYALTELPAHDNPYMTYILTGGFGDALPFYARPGNFAAIRENLGALRLFRGDLSAALQSAGGRFDAWNLSDIFEYMDDALFETVASEIIDRSAAGARIAYWNMLVPRRISERFPERTRYLAELSGRLLLKDRAFFYQSFHVDERLE